MQHMRSLYDGVLLCDPIMKDKVSNYKDYDNIKCTRIYWAYCYIIK